MVAMLDPEEVLVDGNNLTKLSDKPTTLVVGRIGQTLMKKI